MVLKCVSDTPAASAAFRSGLYQEYMYGMNMHIYIYIYMMYALGYVRIFDIRRR